MLARLNSMLFEAHAAPSPSGPAEIAASVSMSAPGMMSGREAALDQAGTEDDRPCKIQSSGCQTAVSTGQRTSA